MSLRLEARGLCCRRLRKIRRRALFDLTAHEVRG